MVAEGAEGQNDVIRLRCEMDHVAKNQIANNISPLRGSRDSLSYEHLPRLLASVEGLGRCSLKPSPSIGSRALT